jgi:hypothetical protein
MVSGIDAGTVTWASLMAQLQQLAVTEEGQPSMASTEASTKEKYRRLPEADSDGG